MNNEDSVVRLLEAAVPPIPASLRTPPYQRIRRRAFRRRLAVACSAGAVIVVLAAAGAVATVNIRRLAPSTLVGGPPVATVDPSPSLPGSPVPWRVVRVDRAGTGLTVYVNPPLRQGCTTYPNPTATVDEGPDIVTITMTAKAVDEECSRTMVIPVHVTLSRPLLDRKVRDGHDGVLGVAVQERDLPAIPPLWTEVPTEFTSLEGGLTIPYTRSGGPDLIFGAGVGTAATTGPAVRLGTRNGAIVQTTTYVAVQWQVGDMVYSMRLMPSEGETSTVAQLHDVIDQLTWP